jgi:CheY-like chemotaxis protein
MAIVLVSDPDPRSRLVLTALVEALGHRAVGDVEGRIDAAVVDPTSPEAVALVRQARQRYRRLPVVCVSATRPRLSGTRLQPLAYLRKPVPVGPFVQTLADTIGQAQHAVRPFESRASRRRREFAAAYR